jgi:hypothetical protein
LPPATGQLPGDLLRWALLPRENFPSGFAPAAPVITSGSRLSKAPVRYKLATLGCGEFVSRLGTPGFGETAMAADDFAGRGLRFRQMIYQFPTPAAATAFVSGVYALTSRCGEFNATEYGMTEQVSMHPDRIETLPGYISVELFPLSDPGGDAVNGRELFTASGVDVFVAAKYDFVSNPPTNPELETMTYYLMKRQAAAALLQ